VGDFFMHMVDIIAAYVRCAWRWHDLWMSLNLTVRDNLLIMLGSITMHAI